MKLSRKAAVSLSAAAAAVVCTPLAAHALTMQDAASSGAASFAVYNCANKPVVEPKTFAFTCDSSGYLAKLTWSSWTSATATATGVLYTDNCKPNCASGKWSHQNVDVVLWRSEAVKGQSGKRGYTEITALFPNHSVQSQNTVTFTAPGAFPGES
jgi:hypothetical protein